MFCVSGFNAPLKVSLKVKDEEFDALCDKAGIISAPYTGRFKWIYIEDAKVFSDKEWKHYILQSYDLIKSKLPRKILAGL